MSHPDDPYRHGGQPIWPAQQPDPYQESDLDQPTSRYQPGPHWQQVPYQQPGPYEYQQPGPFDYQHPSSYQQPGSYEYRQSNPYQQAGPFDYQQAGPYPQPGTFQQPGDHQHAAYQTGPQPTDPGSFGQPTGGWPPYEPNQRYDYGTPPGPPYPQYGLPQPPEPKKRTALMVGSLVAVIALVAAGVATYLFAFRGSAVGAPSPKEAAVNLVNALSKSDMAGLLDGLAPAESAVAKDYLTETFTELKRIQVVKSDARPEQISGVSITAEELTFDEAAEERVNDHLTITKLTDGKITISSDWSQVPLTEQFLAKAFPGGVPKNETRTVDIGDEIAKNKGQPIRIATVKVGDEWYPSLFYSIADAALRSEGKQWPAQSIAANGAESPEAAVRQLMEAALHADVTRLIELTPPDEMAALHDAGQLLVDAAKGAPPAGSKLIDLQTKVSDVAGGKRISFLKLALETTQGTMLSLEVAGDCLKVDDNGAQQQFCGQELAKGLAEAAEIGGTTLTAEQLAAIERVALGYFQSGLVTTEVDGKWYVSPARSVGDISMGFLRKLQPGDLETLIDLVN